YRRRGCARPRSGRRFAGALAARPQPFDRQSRAARLHPRATCRLASPPKDRAMTRRRTLTVTALAVIGIAATSAVDWPTKLIWNATASAPVGFYTVEPADRIGVPELVAIMPSEPLAAFMVERGYIARGGPLLKRVLRSEERRVGE